MTFELYKAAREGNLSLVKENIGDDPHAIDVAICGVSSHGAGNGLTKDLIMKLLKEARADYKDPECETKVNREVMEYEIGLTIVLVSSVIEAGADPSEKFDGVSLIEIRSNLEQELLVIPELEYSDFLSVCPTLYHKVLTARVLYIRAKNELILAKRQTRLTDQATQLASREFYYLNAPVYRKVTYE